MKANEDPKQDQDCSTSDSLLNHGRSSIESRDAIGAKAAEDLDESTRGE
jgi:hypothetical protein